MIVSAGEFWVAEIQFTDGSDSKKRPVLVLWIDGNDVVVSAVTTAAPRSPRDIALASWAQAGLRLPSTARLGRLDCLAQSRLVTCLGNVASADAEQIKFAWDKFVKPQF